MNDKRSRIHRSQHTAENHYMLLSRATAQDKTLSYEASGMLTYILSKPSDWEVQPKDLIREGCGRDKVYRILKELINKRYVVRTIILDKNNRVRGVDYEVFEEPLPEKPDTEIPDPAKPDSTKYRKKQNKEIPAHAENGSKPKAVQEKKRRSTTAVNATGESSNKRAPDFVWEAIVEDFLDGDLSSAASKKAHGAMAQKIKGWITEIIPDITGSEMRAFIKFLLQRSSKELRDSAKFQSYAGSWLPCLDKLRHPVIVGTYEPSGQIATAPEDDYIAPTGVY